MYLKCYIFITLHCGMLASSHSENENYYQDGKEVLTICVKVSKYIKGSKTTSRNPH